jgi:hypothetical protein
MAYEQVVLQAFHDPKTIPSCSKCSLPNCARDAVTFALPAGDGTPNPMMHH